MYFVSYRNYNANTKNRKIELNEMETRRKINAMIT